MSEGNDHAMLNVQHAEPSVYYCYKFWFSNGKVEEGCTEVMTGKNLFLDLNEYGWVYMTIPIVGLFLLVLIFYALCGSGKKSAPQQQPPQEPLDVMSEMAAPTYQPAVPPTYHTNPRGLYSVIPMDTFDQQAGKPRIYPSLPHNASRKPSTIKPKKSTTTNAVVNKKPAAESEELLEKPKKHQRQPSIDSSSSVEELAK